MIKILKQVDANDCGLYVIHALHNYFFTNKIEINQLKLKATYGASGINMKNLMSLGKQFNLISEAYDVSIEDFNQIKNVFVALINDSIENHYVIVKNYKYFVKIYDSIKGVYFLKKSKFKKIFLNKIIIFEKSVNKKTLVDLKNPFTFLSKNMGLIGVICLIVFLEIIFMFISMTYMKIMLDSIIPGMLMNMLFLISIGFIWIGIMKVFGLFMKNFFLKKLENKLNYEIRHLFFYKIAYSPIQQINKLSTSEFLQRLGLIDSIAGFQANFIFVMFHDILLLSISSSILMWISIKLFAIAFLFGAALILFSYLMTYIVKEKHHKSIKYGLNYFVNSIDIVNAIEDLKRDQYNHWIMTQLDHKYFKMKKNENQIWKLSSSMNGFSSILLNCAPIVLTFFGAQKIFESQLSLGSLMLFLTIFQNFIASLQSLCEFLFVYRENKRNTELISFVLSFEDEQINQDSARIGKIEQISFNDFAFGYDKTLFKINLDINEHTHIVGSNGTGKSTLLKIIGLYYLEKNMKINDLEIDMQNINYLRNKIKYISNNNYLPSVSISEYLFLGKEKLLKEFYSNINKYNLMQIIKDAGLNFNMQIINGGENISSGQKQLIRILTLFTQKFDVVILDEALENIDSKKIKLLTHAIQQYHNEALFIEVTHSKKYVIQNALEVDLEKINYR